MKLPIMLACRYFKNASNETSIATMIKLVFWGIGIGTFGLAMTAGIMRGIEKVTHEKLRGINPQISLRSYGDSLNIDAIANVLRAEFPSVRIAAPSSIKQIIVYQEKLREHHALFLKSVDPIQEQQLTNIHTKIIAGPHNLSQALEDDHLIIGESLAQSLSITVDGPITILVAAPDDSENAVMLKKFRARVGAIMKTGIDELDSSLVLSSHAFLNQLFPHEGFTHLNLALHEDANEPQIIEELKKRLSLQVYSWKDLYPALISALKLEKYAMNSILALIILITSICVISLVFMHIVDKQTDIAILRSMGMPYRSLQAIFLLMTMSITTLAALAGLAAAFLAGTLIQHYAWIELPDVYYVSTLPFVHESTTYALIFVLALAVSLLATVVPLKKIKSLHIASLLRTGI